MCVANTLTVIELTGNKYIMRNDAWALTMLRKIHARAKQDLIISADFVLRPTESKGITFL